MLKLVFIAIYWAAWFVLREVFRKYGVPLNERLYNWAAAGLFFLLVVCYAFLSAFFRSYLQVAPAPASETENRRRGESAKSDRQDNAVTKAKQGKDQFEAKEPKEPVTEEPKKKSRVRILRGNQDE